MLLPPARFEQRVELACLDVPGTHEHQVLEQVREAGAAGFSRADPTRYQTLTVTTRHAVIFVEDHVQPVGQRELRVGVELQRAGWRRLARRVPARLQRRAADS